MISHKLVVASHVMAMSLQNSPSLTSGQQCVHLSNKGAPVRNFFMYEPQPRNPSKAHKMSESQAVLARGTALVINHYIGRIRIRPFFPF